MKSFLQTTTTVQSCLERLRASGQAIHDIQLSESLLEQDGEVAHRDSALTKLEIVALGERLLRRGHELDRKGESLDAEMIYRETIDMLETVHADGAGVVDAGSLADLAYKHGLSLFSLGKHDSAAGAFGRCVELFDCCIAQDSSYAVVEKLAGALCWLGLTQRKLKEHVLSRESYLRSVALWKNLLVFSPVRSRRADYRHSLAISLVGLSKVLRLLGQRSHAERCLDESIGLFSAASNKATVRH